MSNSFQTSIKNEVTGEDAHEYYEYAYNDSNNDDTNIEETSIEVLGGTIHNESDENVDYEESNGSLDY